MIDREKVIKALEHCKDNQHVFDCHECDYGGKTGTFCIRMIDDALTLLKEQEAVEPEVEVLNEIDRIYRCPKCHKHFFYEKQKYCDQCGQAVKWDG